MAVVVFETPPLKFVTGKIIASEPIGRLYLVPKMFLMLLISDKEYVRLFFSSCFGVGSFPSISKRLIDCVVLPASGLASRDSARQ